MSIVYTLYVVGVLLYCEAKAFVYNIETDLNWVKFAHTVEYNYIVFVFYNYKKIITSLNNNIVQ